MSFDFNGEGAAGNRGDNMPKTGLEKGFQNTEGTPEKGFRNIPARKEHGGNLGVFQRSTPVRIGNTYSGRTGRFRRRRPSLKREIMIPWRIILTIAGILVLVAVLWVGRDAISAFLSQVLSWIITIIVIILLIRFFIFRR